MKFSRCNSVIITALFLINFSFMLAGCDGTEELASSTDDETTSSDDVDTSDSIIVDEWDIVTGENSADLVDSYSFTTLIIDLDTMVVTSDSDSLVIDSGTAGEVQVSLDGETIITLTEETFGVMPVSESPEDMLIEYALYSGFDQTVTIFSDYDFKLSLNSINISSTDGPAINIQSKQREFIELPDSSYSTLSDTTNWSDRYLDDGDEMDLKGTVFSEGPIIFYGEGALDITANKKHVLASDDHVRLQESSISITSYNKDGVRCNDAFIMDSGVLYIGMGVRRGWRYRYPG
jgi:hypothetical protein